MPGEFLVHLQPLVPVILFEARFLLRGQGQQPHVVGLLLGDLGAVVAEILDALQHRALVAQAHPAIGRPLLELDADVGVGKLGQLLQLDAHEQFILAWDLHFAKTGERHLQLDRM